MPTLPAQANPGPASPGAENSGPDGPRPEISRPAASGSPPAGPALPVEIQRAIAAVYSDLDREVRALGVGCWARGDCCDFERSDHRLYSSSLEIAHVRENHPQPFPPSSALCPFWRDGRCTERERRPLGCRTYFCDRRYRDRLEALYEKYHGRLRALAEEHGLAWRYEPFVDALRGRAGRP